jgi:hypothetical protein
MTTQVLKSELINWLSGLTDRKLLESLHAIKNSVEGGDWYNHLTESQKQSLEKGIQDHRDGKYLTSEAFWARYEKKA